MIRVFISIRKSLMKYTNKKNEKTHYIVNQNIHILESKKNFKSNDIIIKLNLIFFY